MLTFGFWFVFFQNRSPIFINDKIRDVKIVLINILGFISQGLFEITHHVRWIIRYANFITKSLQMFLTFIPWHQFCTIVRIISGAFNIQIARIKPLRDVLKDTAFQFIYRLAGRTTSCGSPAGLLHLISRYRFTLGTFGLDSWHVSAIPNFWVRKYLLFEQFWGRAARASRDSNRVETPVLF